MAQKASGSTALVVNCWDDSNKGDAAITIGVLNSLKLNRVADRLQVSSYVVHASQPEMAHAFRHVKGQHPQVELIPCYLPALSRSVGKVRAMLRFGRSLFKLLAPGFIPDTDLDAAVRHSTVVASNGGLYFGFKPTSFMDSLYHLVAFSYPMLLARRLGVPYVLYSQSFGPFPSGFSKAWMRRIVFWSSGTWCRESLSRDLLIGLNADASKLNVVPDAAFGIKASLAPKVLERFPQLRPHEFIAISLRSLAPSGFTQDAELRYRDSFRLAISWVVEEKKMPVLLVAHTLGPISEEDDRIITREIYNTLAPEIAAKVTVCDQDLSPQELCDLYGQARIIVATRFHAVVLSICGGAPVIAVPYFGLKTQGAFKDLGLSSFVLEVSEMDGNVLKNRIQSSLATSAELRTQVQGIALRQYEGAMESGAKLREIAERSDKQRSKDTGAADGASHSSG